MTVPNVKHSNIYITNKFCIACTEISMYITTQPLIATVFGFSKNLINIYRGLQALYVILI